MVDLTAVLTPEQGRSIESITNDILQAKREGGKAILTIGRCLTEAKQVLPHGEWLPWLNEKVEFSERTARRFMQLYRRCTNRPALADLGATKALVLLALPDSELDEFMGERHVVNGEEKTVIDMSARQLEQAIRERDEARKQAAAASANAELAEHARDKMAADMEAANNLLAAAQSERDEAAEREKALRTELEKLRAVPVDVAVMQVDQEALDKAREEGRAELQKKLDRAKEQKSKAEEKRKAAEESLAEVREQLALAQKAAKDAVISNDKDMAAFEVLFLQSQEIVNKLRGILLKLRGRDDQTSAQAVQKAMRALGEAIGRAAE